MDCGLPDFLEGSLCNFSPLQGIVIQNTPRTRELKDILFSARIRFASRVSSLIEANQGRLDEFGGSADELRGRIGEIRTMLHGCDEACVLGYFDRYFRKQMNQDRVTKLKANQNPGDFLEAELSKYLSLHPKIEREIRTWYDAYNHGKYEKRDLIKLVPPLLDAIEKKTGATFGFIPVRGGFVSIMRNTDGSFYALKGDTLSSGKTLEKALSPFVHEMTILQILDKNGRVIGTLETPLSRSLEALLFIDHHRSAWSLMTKETGKAIDIQYHHDGHQIKLFTPREGFQMKVSEGMDTVPGVGKVYGQNISIGYNMRTSFSESTLSVGSGRLKGEGYDFRSTQGSLSNHIRFADFHLGEKPLSLHGIGDWNLAIQGNFKKPDTAKLEGTQAIIVAGENSYIGTGRVIRWTPDVLERKYYHFTKDPLFVAGYRYNHFTVDSTFSTGVKKMSIADHSKSSSLRATIEYQKRANALLSHPELRGEISYMKTF